MPLTPIDLRGTLLLSAFWNMLFPLMLLYVARHHEQSIPGLKRWAGAQTALFFSLLFFALRDQLPDAPSILLGNGLLILGIMLLYQGTQRFFDRPIARWPWAILLLAEAVVTYWTFWPDYRWRVLTISLACASIQIAHFALVWRHDRRTLIARSLLLALALSTTAFLLRAVLTPLDSAQARLFDPNPHQALYLFTQAFLNFCLGLGVLFLGQQRVFAELRRLSRNDPLTGTLNRRAVMEQGRYELERQRRSQRSLSVLLMDIDHFKSINDCFGHAEGDRVLRDLVARTGQTLRTTDTLGRLGGEEFLVILPETCADEAARIAERIRIALEAPTEGLSPYSVSIGVATHEHRPQTPDELRARQQMTTVEKAQADQSALEETIARADGALYEAKRAGRNQVVSAPHEPLDQERPAQGSTERDP